MRRVETFGLRETNVEALSESINTRLQELADRKPNVLAIHYQTAPYRLGEQDFVYHHALMILDLLEEGEKRQVRIM
jgi:hypothetical protein